MYVKLAFRSDDYPEFCHDLFYFVIPDAAVEGMQVKNHCAAYTLQEKRPDVTALQQELIYCRDTEYGQEEECDFYFREYWRLYRSATAGALIIGTLYVATVFVCMALAILSLKTLSTLEEERRRYAVLFRLGADRRMQRRALRRQMGVFFLMPFILPVLLMLPIGSIFGKIYEGWGLPGLENFRAMETSVLITAVIAGIFVLYFFLTYRIAWLEMRKEISGKRD